MIGQKRLQGKVRIILILGFGAAYIGNFYGILMTDFTYNVLQYVPHEIHKNEYHSDRVKIYSILHKRW